MDQLSASELIYVYLDGEATPLQQELLFSHLAHNQELQQEFTDALSIGKAFRQERTSSKPPLYLSSRVFADAGIPYHGVDVAAVSAAAGASWFSLRRFILPVSAMMVGVLATYAALTYGSLFSGADSGTTASNESTADVRDVPSRRGSLAMQSDVMLSTATERTSARAVSGGAADVKGVSGSRERAEIVSDVQSTAASPSASSEVSLSGTESTRDDLGDAGMSATSEFGAWTERRISVVPYASSQRLSTVRRAESVVPGFVGTAASAFTLQANRLVRADVFGGSSGTASAGDPSLALLMNLDDQWSVGVSFSRNAYRFSDVTAQGMVLDNPRFTVVNAEAQWISDEAVAMDAKLFSRAAVGVAGVSGALFGTGSFTVGLQIPVSVFTLQPGIALESVLVNSRSGLPLHTRISFVTGIGVNL